MQIVVQQSETQIVRPNAIRTVLIHTYRRCGAQLGFEILVQRCKPAVKPDHQREFFPRGQLHQLLSLTQVFRQRLIHTHVNSGIQQFTDDRIVSRGAGMDENRVAGLRQIHQ
ncbi:hypothetical protein CITFRE_16860 [Citrobacter freundii]|nr:hypothetical protein CITFRE_16860 [Citrobacter freundii]